MFFDFFEAQAAQLVKAAQGLLAFSLPTHDPKASYATLHAIEGAADQITHACIETLHKTFITPIERSDIYRLISKMDDVIDQIHDVSKLLVLYKIKQLEKESLELTNHLIAAALEVEKAVGKLRKNKDGALQEHFIHLNTIENAADVIFTQAIGRLFEEEKDVLTILKWKEIYELLENAIDACEDVGNILEGIILENE